jgi:hypothetical protein
MNRATVIAAICMLTASVAAPAATSPQRVDEMLAKGKEFLYSKQHNGNWEVTDKPVENKPLYSQSGAQWGGLTSLSVYALLASGESPQDPRLAPAIAWVEKAEIVGTYALGMRCQIWPLLPQTPEIHKLALRDYDRLVEGFNQNGRGTGLYWYLTNKRAPDVVDHSVSQFGVLGTWACAQADVEVPSRYWELVEKRWIADQQTDGGWMYADKPDPNYEPHSHTQASMTAAGVATLFITQEFVHAHDGINCTGNLRNEHIDAGLKWMADHTGDWIPDAHYGDPPYWLPGYTLYGVERIGVASGLKYIGSVDWYQFGADWCSKFQAPWGAWGDKDDVPNTALCMLFLSRGRAPVVMSKLQYDNADGPDKGKPGKWNQRPRDVANFVHWMSRQTERDLNWQITSLDVPADELSDAPILYIAGNQPLTLSPEHKTKLKAFIEQGGMILCNADCNGEGFSSSVLKLGRDLFPQYEFRNLPADHPIFTSEQYTPRKWKNKVVLRGLSNGVRELIVLLPIDAGRAWQTDDLHHAEALEPAANIVLYATGKQNLRVKGSTYLVSADSNIRADRSVKVARLKYGGEWDPEPGGWRRLAAIMHNQCKVDVNVETVELGTTPLDGYTVAHLTGTGKFKLGPVQEEALKKFIDGGGTLLIDSAGGGAEFATAAESLLQEMYPAGLKDALPPDDPIFTAGTASGKMQYRDYARALLGNLRTPRIKAISVNGRNAVYYSREDLSGGLVGEPVDGIIGYEPDTAVAIVSGAIVRAMAK